MPCCNRRDFTSMYGHSMYGQGEVLSTQASAALLSDVAHVRRCVTLPAEHSIHGTYR